MLDAIPLTRVLCPKQFCVLCYQPLLDGERVDGSGMAHWDCAQQEFRDWEECGPRLDGKDYDPF